MMKTYKLFLSCLLLALLAQAYIPTLTEELLPEKDKTSKEARTA